MGLGVRFIRVGQVGGHDYVLSHGPERPQGFVKLESLERAPMPRRWLREALLRQPGPLVAFLDGDRRPPAGARSTDQLERALDGILDELVHGGPSAYRLWRVPVGFPRLDPIRLDVPEKHEPPPPLPPPEPSDHWITLEILDAEQAPAVGVGYELLLPDGDQRSGSSDGDGRVQIQGIAESGHCKLSFPDVDAQAAVPEAAVTGTIPAIAYLRQTLSLPVDAHHTLRLPPELMRAHFVEFDDVFFSFNSTALLPETKDHTPPNNAEGEPITGLNLCVAVLQYVEQFEGDKSLLVLGHTDTVGSDQDNVSLSQHRAQVVYGLVSGDRQAFMDAVDAPHITDKQTKAKVLIPDKNFVLDWVAEHTGWPCGFAENHNDHWAATEQLQIHYNEHGHEFGGSAQLDVDRDFGRQTWGAVFDVYQDYVADTLEISHDELRVRQAAIPWVAPQTKHAGCGEYHPLDLIDRDGVRSATNRRAEAVFFDPGEAPALECFAGGCAQRQCELFAPHKIIRKPLPPSWKLLWKVAWDKPGKPARMGESRDILLTAPKLEDSAEVTFTIEQEVDGKRREVATLHAVASNERAQVSFGAWFNPETVLVNPELLAADQPYPKVVFHVSASTAERDVEGRRPLVYGDTLEAEVAHALVEREFEAEHVAPAECVLHSPWGRKLATIDEDGLIYVEGLPPGGVMITIDDDLYYAD